MLVHAARELGRLAVDRLPLRRPLPRTVTEAVVQFKKPPRPLFTDPDDAPKANYLRFEMKPRDQITLGLQ